jgi:hypothetical protein
MTKPITCEGCTTTEACMANNTCASHKAQLVQCCELCDTPMCCHDDGECHVFLAKFEEMQISTGVKDV